MFAFGRKEETVIFDEGLSATVLPAEALADEAGEIEDGLGIGDDIRAVDDAVILAAKAEELHGEVDILGDSVGVIEPDFDEGRATKRRADATDDIFDIEDGLGALHLVADEVLEDLNEIEECAAGADLHIGRECDDTRIDEIASRIDECVWIK